MPRPKQAKREKQKAQSARGIRTEKSLAEHIMSVALAAAALTALLLLARPLVLTREMKSPELVLLTL